MDTPQMAPRAQMSLRRGAAADELSPLAVMMSLSLFAAPLILVAA